LYGYIYRCVQIYICLYMCICGHPYFWDERKGEERRTPGCRLAVGRLRVFKPFLSARPSSPQSSLHPPPPSLTPARCAARRWAARVAAGPPPSRRVSDPAPMSNALDALCRSIACEMRPLSWEQAMYRRKTTKDAPAATVSRVFRVLQAPTPNASRSAWRLG